MTAPLDLTAVHLYDGSFCSSLDAAALADYLRPAVPRARVLVHGEFFQHHLPGGELQERIHGLARDFACCKVIDPRERRRASDPLPGEINYEIKRIRASGRQPAGILYDGERLMDICNFLLPEHSRGSHTLHLILTNQLFGTWSRDDLRFHARAAVYGIPCIISTTGLVEAPAKSREYYLLQHLGISAAARETRFRGQFLVYDDPRLTTVVKGYCMQALFFHLTGEPFCKAPDCRLYNAHWQHELLRAQLEAPVEFCPRHHKMLEELRLQA